MESLAVSSIRNVFNHLSLDEKIKLSLVLSLLYKYVVADIPIIETFCNDKSKQEINKFLEKTNVYFLWVKGEIYSNFSKNDVETVSRDLIENFDSILNTVVVFQNCNLDDIEKFRQEINVMYSKNNLPTWFFQQKLTLKNRENSLFLYYT